MLERKKTYFDRWAEQEGIPVIRGYYVEDLYRVPLERWERKGGLGALILLEGGEGWTNAYVCEIPPQTSLKPQRHLFEEQIFILKGQGETRVWVEGYPEQKFVWQENSLFSVPLNAWHEHRNRGDHPVRYVAITDALMTFNLYQNRDFIFGCDFVFKDRYAGEKDYFDGVGRVVGKDSLGTEQWEGGFIRNVKEIALGKSAYFGKGFDRLPLYLSRNSWGAHLGGVKVGSYKKAHRHQGGAHIIIVEGTGYAYVWPERGQKKRIDFQRGTLYSPPENWWHTHFNTGTEEVLQIAFRNLVGVGKSWGHGVSFKKGGDLLEFEDEDPEIRRDFVEELRKKGITCTMPKVK